MRCGRNEKNSNTRLTRFDALSGRLCSVLVSVLTLEHWYISDFRGACVSSKTRTVCMLSECYVVCFFSVIVCAVIFRNSLPLSFRPLYQCVCLSLFRWVSLLLGCFMAYIYISCWRWCAVVRSLSHELHPSRFGIHCAWRALVFSFSVPALPVCTN